MKIAYALEPNLSAREFADVLARTSLAQRRPMDQPDVLEGMIRNADIIVTARNDAGLLVGISRAITDNWFCTYLSCLAVDEAYQRQGIGKQLIRRTHETAGLHTTLLLVAAPEAKTYYGHIGMERHDSCWQITGKRK